MRIIVVGAGEVGSYVADRLSKEGADVAVIEIDHRKLQAVEQDHDVQTVLGNGTHPSVLESAGTAQADLLVAVTSSDAVNLLACLSAKQLGVKRALARIESAGLRSADAEKLHNAVGADAVIDPDAAVASDIISLLELPGATQVQKLAGGEVILIGADLSETAPFAHKSLREIGQAYEPEWEFIVATITRNGETIIPRKDHHLEPGDSLRVLCKRRAKAEVIEQMGLERGRHRRVMLLGGGRTAEHLAKALVKGSAEVSLIERQPDRARQLAAELDGVLVLQGDITDAKLLEAEEVAHQDAVIALTGDDDANILACLFAKSKGARETISMLHRLELGELLHQVGIDAALSPRTASANAVLRNVRLGITDVATSLDSDVEVFEVEVGARSAARDSSVADLPLPRDTLIAAIVREDGVQIGRRWCTFEWRDHVIVVAKAEKVDAIRELFT